MKRLRLFALGLLTLTATSCGGLSVKEYMGQKPDFDFENFFSGPLEADGFFQDRSGRIVKRIHCQMRAHKETDSWVIDEDFTYSDGSRDQRTWTIKKNSNGDFEGTAGDVVGPAKIEIAGFAFHMNYTLRLKIDGREIDVAMDDWMYRMSERLVINKTKMSKLGFRLGEVSLAINKL